ncbi:DNA metabolism protein [Lithospermum erythrorhizon]|uniref:DNA metabolism protein n=1 Tax=Lithospermum erythrorhizon TaxID=34254 RepID=A0AAV3QUH1_LITER
MGSLECLEEKYPIIDSEFRQFCASHNILSVEDFLMQDLYALNIVAEQRSNPEKLKLGITQILDVMNNQHQPWLNGQELLENALLNKQSLSVGCDRINALLQGGLRKGRLTELVGPSSSGKTQICFQAASYAATHGIANVMFIDTGNSFSPKRIAQFVNKMSNHVIDQESLRRIMNKIVCHSVYDILSLLDILHQLEINLKHQNDFQVMMLIVDSLSSLITPVLGADGAHGHALLVQVGFMLKKIAYEHNIAVLVTNHMVASEGGSLKPALGERWKSIPHVRLHLSRDSSNNTSWMSILGHPSVATGVAVEFEMMCS